MNVIVITGASSGIGAQFALQMDEGFSNVDEFWLVARRQERLEDLARSLFRHKTRIFAMDITDKEKVTQLEKALREHNATVRILINCAGYGVMGPFDRLDREQTLGMVRLNCEALTEVTYRLMPFLKRNSRIIQMASSAAFMPQPGFAVYAATKAYVYSFSRALGAELKERGIYVTSVCPGPVDTPFFDIAEKDGTVLAVKKWFLVSPADVAEQALMASLYKKPVSVYSLPIKAFRILTKILPQSLLLKGAEWLSDCESAKKGRNERDSCR